MSQGFDMARDTQTENEQYRESDAWRRFEELENRL
jgi:hypothetical protein